MNKNEKFEFSKATWENTQIVMPAVCTPQPTGSVIAFNFLSSWGSPTCEIITAKVQDEEGNLIDTLIPDKWFLNAEAFPEAIYFTLSKRYKPAFILIENGLAMRGVKEMEIYIEDRPIWKGEVPQASPEICSFTIALPIDEQVIQRPRDYISRPKSAFT